MQKENVILATIVAILSIVGTCFAISDRFVSKELFITVGIERASQLVVINSRLETIDKKLDRLLESQKGRR